MNPTDILVLLVTWGMAACLASRRGRTPSDLGQASLLFVGGAWHTFFQWLRHRSWLRHRGSGFAPGTQLLALLRSLAWGSASAVRPSGRPWAGEAISEGRSMEPCKVWIEQCDAARRIEDEFGADKALAYLVGEKFLNFLEAAETHADFRAEIPAFVAEIKTIFEPWQLAEYLETARQTEPFDPALYDEDDDPEDVEMDRQDDIDARPGTCCWSKGRGDGCWRGRRLMALTRSPRARVSPPAGSPRTTPSARPR